jgi:hypothetical protein
MTAASNRNAARRPLRRVSGLNAEYVTLPGVLSPFTGGTEMPIPAHFARQPVWD